MEFIAISAPRWANLEHTVINVTIGTDLYGDIPFSATSNDVEEYGRMIFNAASSGVFGEVGEFVAPPIDYAAKAESERTRLADDAERITADWRTELKLDVISDADKESLIKWMAYIKALKALDLTLVTDEAAYSGVKWPDEPE